MTCWPLSFCQHGRIGHLCWPPRRLQLIQVPWKLVWRIPGHREMLGIPTPETFLSPKEQSQKISNPPNTQTIQTFNHKKVWRPELFIGFGRKVLQPPALLCFWHQPWYSIHDDKYQDTSHKTTISVNFEMMMFFSSFSKKWFAKSAGTTLVRRPNLPFSTSRPGGCVVWRKCLEILHVKIAKTWSSL